MDTTDNLVNLIQHQTFSVTSIDFTIYRVSTDYHYLTWTDIDTGTK